MKIKLFKLKYFFYFLIFLKLFLCFKFQQEKNEENYQINEEKTCSSSFSSSCSNNEDNNNIHIVIASLGSLNLDNNEDNEDNEDKEDLSWIPKQLNKKKVYLYDRTNQLSPYYINTMNGNECLTYMKYIIDNYNNLPDAVIFIHADAKRHCPTIQNILEKSNEEIISKLHSPLQQIPGYISLSKVFLNHSYENLKYINLGILELSNEVLTIKCQYYKQQLQQQSITSKNNDENNPCDIPLDDDFPQFTTTYTSGSFIVSRNNILSIPLSFYLKFYNKLYAGPQYVDTTCGALEYVWTTIWGGKPFIIQPDPNSLCGSLYYADIASNYGFLFYKSDDGSVESGYLPDQYYGYLYNQKTREIKNGIHKYEEID